MALGEFEQLIVEHQARRRDVVEDVLEQLWAVCQRVEVTGTLRRAGAHTDRLEFLCVPKMEEQVVQRGLPGMAQDVTVPCDRLTEMLETGVVGWALQPEPDGVAEALKMLAYKVVVDVFDVIIYRCPTLAQWGVLQVMCTGPEGITDRLAQWALLRSKFIEDYRVHGHMSFQKRVPCNMGERCALIEQTLEEEQAFAALGLEYIAPEVRTLAAWKVAEKKALGLSERARY